MDLQVVIEVKGDEISIDFPDAPSQVRAPINMVYTALLVCANLIVDLLYAWIDPRIRLT